MKKVPGWLDTVYEVQAKDVKTGRYLAGPTPTPFTSTSKAPCIGMKRPTTNEDLPGQIDILLFPPCSASARKVKDDPLSESNFIVLTLPPEYPVRVSDIPSTF